MSNIHTLLDEHDLDVATIVDALSTDDILATLADEDVSDAQIIDAVDAEVYAEPTAFYDGEPSVEDLRADFEAVDMLAEKRDDLDERVDNLRNEVREARRPVYADKAEQLAQITDRWGDEDDLMDHFDADDEDDVERWSVDDIDDKIDLATDILEDNDTTTTLDGAGGNGGEDDDLGGSQVDTSVQLADEDDIGTTSRGKRDLSSVRN